ncbi:UDP-2,3-diacylglucosamine diphosphatase [Winogradskyella sp.]|nr:UDP-2,3-diacylglucosamine diphosphatase [Winogradskyella sp.]MDC1229990.1 UDP-2,3-diacylglucosamine diphosphatase [bacterium]
MNLKRKVEIAVISDVNLGAKACYAVQLLTYLNSIAPKTLILNGAIFDASALQKKKFPKSHLKVINKIKDYAADGTKVMYVTNNNDKTHHQFINGEIDNISIINKLVINLDGKKVWFFNGDVFAFYFEKSRWLKTFINSSFSTFLLFHQYTNWVLNKLGKDTFLLQKNTKTNLKSDSKYVAEFEKIVADLAIAKGYDFVVCGHTQQPKILTKNTKKGKTTYLNSGDWVENFTALEYQFKRWKLYNYKNDKLSPFFADMDLKDMTTQNLIAALTIV